MNEPKVPLSEYKHCVCCALPFVAYGKICQSCVAAGCEENCEEAQS